MKVRMRGGNKAAEGEAGEEGLTAATAAKGGERTQPRAERGKADVRPGWKGRDGGGVF